MLGMFCIIATSCWWGVSIAKGAAASEVPAVTAYSTLLRASLTRICQIHTLSAVRELHGETGVHCFEMVNFMRCNMPLASCMHLVRQKTSMVWVMAQTRDQMRPRRQSLHTLIFKRNAPLTWPPQPPMQFSRPLCAEVVVKALWGISRSQICS